MKFFAVLVCTIIMIVIIIITSNKLILLNIKSCIKQGEF